MRILILKGLINNPLCISAPSPPEVCAEYMKDDQVIDEVELSVKDCNDNKYQFPDKESTSIEIDLGSEEVSLDEEIGI